MTHPAYLREKAKELRIRKKLTLTEIAERLALPKTTVWYWIRDLPVPDNIARYDTPPMRAARIKAAHSLKETYRLRREAVYQQGWDEYPDLIGEPTFRDFVVLYIGEGYKRCRNTVSLANSDPRVIRIAKFWICRFARNPVTYPLQYHADQDVDYLRQFWSFGLGVRPDLIRFQRKSNSGQLKGRSWRSKFGVLTVYARDTYLRARLQAWMDRTQDGWLDSLIAGRGAAW